MKKILLLIGLLITISSCNKQVVLTDIPMGIREKIDKIKNSKVLDPPAKVYSYEYDNQIVYYFPASCCDIPSKLYDRNGKFICSPDGGFSGKGDGKCTDFFNTMTNEKLIWEDSRK